MTTTRLLAQYRNGNCQVTLFSDGTKTREWDGAPAPEFPESIDLKVTNSCDHACAFCHEQSTPRGEYASWDTISAVTRGLPPGVELAIGGGNPLTHPELDWMLELFHDRDLIANITVHSDHYIRAAGRILRLQGARLLYGVGISQGQMNSGVWALVKLPKNLVWHVIAGVVPPADLLHYGGTAPVLVLGYKQYGHGVQAYEAGVEACLDEWRYWMGTILRRIAARGQTVCFDNLALRQLGVQALVDPVVWQQSYMGDDGRFTMYVDAVTDTFAPTSTSTRIAREGRSIREMFATVREATDE